MQFQVKYLKPIELQATLSELRPDKTLTELRPDKALSELHRNKTIQQAWLYNSTAPTALDAIPDWLL